MPMGRYSASSSVSSDLAAAASGPPAPPSGGRGAAVSRVTPSASSSRVTALGATANTNGEAESPTTPANDTSQAIGSKMGESFISLKTFTSSVVKSFSLSAGLFQAASDNDQEKKNAATKSKTTIRYQGATGVTSPTGTASSSAVTHHPHPLPRQQSNVVSDMVSHHS